MIVLQDTNDTIEFVLAGAVSTAELPFVASWRDAVTSSGFTPGRSNVTSSGATPVTAVAAPLANTKRLIDFISIYNADTAAATVTVRIDDNATEYVLTKVALAVGERLEYSDGQGWRVLDANGSNKMLQAGAAAVSGLQTTVLAGDVTNNNAVANTISDVTGLSFSVTSGGKYWFKFIIPYTSAATTTGSRWAVTGPALTSLNMTSHYCLTATTKTVNYVSAYDTPAASNASSLAAGNVAILEGVIVPSGSGTVIARFASEVSNSAIVAKAGAIVYYQQIA